MKKIVKTIPVVGLIAQRVYSALFSPPTNPFHDSATYWENRYQAGGNSGDGSYNRLAEFKARVLNEFCFEQKIVSVIEYGCGDGNQLSMAKYPKYLGFDVSQTAIDRCLRLFSGDSSKTFKLSEEYGGETAELTISLDVIYHLVEDAVFVDYMSRLFDSSDRFVIIYSSNSDENPEGTAEHVRHRNFSKWITENKAEWRLMKHIANTFPFSGDASSGSFADFYVYTNA